MKIGLVDGPVATTHPDLADEHLCEIPGTYIQSNSAACLHGTFVAGILSAKRNSPAPAIWAKAGNERGLRALGFEAIYTFICRVAYKGEDLWRYLTRATNTVVRADRGLHGIPPRIAFPS